MHFIPSHLSAGIVSRQRQVELLLTILVSRRRAGIINQTKVAAVPAVIRAIGSSDKQAIEAEVQPGAEGLVRRAEGDGSSVDGLREEGPSFDFEGGGVMVFRLWSERVRVGDGVLLEVVLSVQPAGLLAVGGVFGAKESRSGGGMGEEGEEGEGLHFDGRFGGI